MSWRDPKFKYVKSEDMEPGYLREKFRKIAKAMEQPKPQKMAPPVFLRKVGNGR